MNQNPFFFENFTRRLQNIVVSKLLASMLRSSVLIALWCLSPAPSTAMHALQTFQAVRVNTTSSSSKLYLIDIKRGVYRLIPDIETAKFLGFSSADISDVTMSSLSEKYHVGSDMPVINQKGTDPDEILRVNLQRIISLQDNLIEKLDYLGEMINPSLLVVKDRLLACVGDAWPTFKKDATELIHCKWMNHSTLPFYSTNDYYGFSSTEFRLPDVTFLGQDPRLVLYPKEDKISISYTYRFERYVRMGTSEWTFNTTAQPPVYNVTKIVKSIAPLGNDWRRDHKNWSPFIHNDTVLYIMSINPLHVASTVTTPGPDPLYPTMEAATVSLQPDIHLGWGYGHLRGGTNAVRLKDRYLSFFHSSHLFEGAPCKTYFMGAYTFSLDPPFRLLSYSPFPIIDTSLYQGAWALFKNRRNDYVIFPMGLIVRDNTVYVSFGRNDHEGWLATLRLDKVLDSLVST